VTTDSSVSARLARRLPALLTELAAETTGPDVALIAADVMRVLVNGLHEGRLATADELAELRRTAVRHAEEGTPLVTLITGCNMAARLTLGALIDEVGADSESTLRSAGGALLRLLEQVTATLASAYVEEQQAIHGEERDARRALANALIAGDQVDGPAARLGVRVAPAYVALALHLGWRSDEAASHGGDAVAARQRLRRVQEQLDTFAGDDVLGLLDATGGTVLLPVAPERITSMLADLPQLLEDLRAAIGTDVIAGAAGCVGVVSVSRAARQARDVLAIARRLGRPPGVYLLDDVLLEYQLTRDSDARPLLAGLLDPLDTNADLLHTLESYFESDLDRRTTAAALHVHPNTLDYRLRRVAQLTGIDPGRPSGQQLLAAALTARHLQ
jgi:hypothetical protein